MDDDLTYDDARYYDRQGRPISFEQWADLFNDPDYQRVACTILEDGIIVSTVWMGLDHGFGREGHLIFETMVFPKDASEDRLCHRYTTEAAAIADHDQIVAALGEHGPWWVQSS
jgi:hypothetical protein